MRAHLEYAHTVDPAGWRRLHADGLVPDSLPYGLDRLEHHGFELSVRPQLDGLVGHADAVVRRLTGGMSVIESALARERRGADVSLCWDLRSGAAAALRSRLPGEPPVVTGVIWLTEDNSFSGLGRAMGARAVATAAGVWVMSEAQLPPLREHWKVPERRLYYVNMGIDSDFWSHATGDPDPDLVVGAGNDRHRDHPLLVKALSELRSRRHVRLELASHAPVAVPPELGVRHARLSHPEMRDLYARASVVALALQPNLHISGLSVILEAMSSGRPVVVTETPGIRDYVEHGVTGLVVPPGEPSELAAAVGELLDEPERARELGRAGRAAVDARFSTEHQAAALGDVLRASLEH